MKANAVLILGPTGSGKSPLGDHLASAGLDGSRCCHLDFGRELRRIAGSDIPPPEFDENEHTFVREVITGGLLLENEHFHLAQKIILDFFRRNSFGSDDTLVLNGFPRHVDQAKDLASFVSVRGVIVLSCGTEDVVRRIGMNSGGDRTGRTDDAHLLIMKKLEIFSSRTAPLVEHYRASRVPVFECRVTEHTTPACVCRDIPAGFFQGSQRT